MDNERYNYYKAQHPDWTEEQIWTAISIDMQTKQAVSNGNEDVDLTNPETVADIIRKASEWLKEVLPHIFEKIGKVLDHAIATVVSWVKHGFKYLQELIQKTFNV